MVALSLLREDGRVLSHACVLADNPLSRLRGLMLRPRLKPGEGLYLATSSIHTHFMRFPIDAVFLDREMTVVRVEHRLRPWRFAYRRGAQAVVELEAGVCERVGLAVGERLALVARDDGSGADAVARTIRVAIGTRDRRFHRVASFLLSRNGFAVDESHDPDGLAELVGRGSVDVVLLDASESLAGAARTVRTLEALAPDIGLVLAVNGNASEDTRAGHIATVPKWGSFEAVVGAVEHSFAASRRGQPD